VRAGTGGRHSSAETPQGARRFWTRAARIALFCLLAAFLAACAKNAPQDYLKPVGESAIQADKLLKMTLVVAGIVFVLVEGGLIMFVFKFRRRSDTEAPVQTHGNSRAEFIWTLIPVVILAVVAVPTVKGIFAFAEVPKGDVLTVEVHGKQWWWEYRYPGLGAKPGEPLVTANELHMPTGKPVFLKMTADDVIHSFWVPKLSGKQDVVPGRINTMTLQSDTEGVFLGQCAEYCGTSHALMRLKVFVHSPEDFERWVEEQRQVPQPPVSNSLAARGQDLFINGRGGGSFGDAGPACASCHTVAGVERAIGVTGPNLTHLYSRTTFAGAVFPTTPEKLTNWLKDPPKEKPGSVMPKLELTDDEIRALVAYLETLK
jgi:cytochrome c oxidase subunit II